MTGTAKTGMLVGFVLLLTQAEAAVRVSPAYWDFGSIEQGSEAKVTLRFRNTETQAVAPFTVSCDDPSEEFHCDSHCSSLPANGSCSVEVRFTPHRGDHVLYWMNVRGEGPGVGVSATVKGVDRPKESGE